MSRTPHSGHGRPLHRQVEAACLLAASWNKLGEVKLGGGFFFRLTNQQNTVSCKEHTRLKLLPRDAFSEPKMRLRTPDQIEAVQKRALNIIFASTYGMPYHNALFIAGLTSLASRREQLARNFFNSTVQLTSCLHYLLLPPRDPELLTRLRAPTKFPRSSNRTKKYQSSIHYGLSKFQTG